MNRQQVEKWEWLQLLAGLAAIALIGYFLFRTFTLLVNFLSRVDSTVGAAIVASMTTLLVKLGGALVTQYQIRKRQAEESHREEKIKLYSKFLDTIASSVAHENKNLNQKKMPQNELLKFLFAFKTGLVLRGSSEVIHAMAKFEDMSRADGDVLGAVDDVYRAIRKDVGLSNRGLKRNELVGVYLKSEDRQKIVR